ncbi:MAG TPA: PAS domain S-box protein [Burkholderiales bacterium]
MAFVQQEKPAASPFGEHLYRLIAETIPMMVWTADVRGELDFVNQRVLDFTGLSASEIVGGGWKKVIHPDDWERNLADWSRALRAGERAENDMRLRRADGKYRWFHGTGVPMRDAQDRITGWFGVCNDIEDQMRSAQLLEAMVEERTGALRDAQSRLAAIIENEPECVKVLDASGTLLEMNAAGLRMIEADSSQQVVGQVVYGIIAPEHRAAFSELTERVCHGERGTLEFEIVGLKGTRRWMETHAAPFRDQLNGSVRLLGITRDITERRQTEQALRESEQRFQSFMDHLPALAWIRDADFRYTYVNRTFARYRGLEPSQMIGGDAADLLPPEIARRIRATDQQVLAAGRPMQFIDGLPTGQWMKVKFPLVDASGKVSVAGIAIDVSARVDAEETARRYAQDVRSLLSRLVSAQESERRRIADNLHDLIGQNLTALGIELGALKARLSVQNVPVATPRLEAMAGLLNDTIESIRGVMTELRPPALEEFGLVPAVHAYTVTFGERTGLKVSANVSGLRLRLPAEAELALFRILQEALTNAAKHSQCTSVEITLTEAERGIRLVVQDDGRGFSERKGARSARRGGWGLPAMRERAEAHGGTLRVEFPGHGTRLVVEIPGTDAD